MPSARCAASATTPRKPAAWPIMRSMRRCAGTSIPGWRGFSTSPSTGASSSRAGVLRETEVSALYDGGNNVGILAIDHTARAAIAKAATHGFAIVGVTNSWMSGRRAYYVAMIANVDLIGVHTASSARAVAPPGGRHLVVGTNPIAFGMPASRRPVVFDMVTSGFMGTELMYPSDWGSCCRKAWRSSFGRSRTRVSRDIRDRRQNLAFGLSCV